jgi:hypothetical protein
MISHEQQILGVAGLCCSTRVLPATQKQGERRLPDNNATITVVNVKESPDAPRSNFPTSWQNG